MPSKNCLQLVKEIKVNKAYKKNKTKIEIYNISRDFNVGISPKNRIYYKNFFIYKLNNKYKVK